MQWKKSLLLEGPFKAVNFLMEERRESLLANGKSTTCEPVSAVFGGVCEFHAGDLCQPAASIGEDKRVGALTSIRFTPFQPSQHVISAHANLNMLNCRNGILKCQD